MDRDAYAAQLQALLPSGEAWPRDPDAVLTRLLTALASELAAVDARARELLAEAHPLTASETLTEWEAEYGLPDACAGAADGLEARRAAVHQRMIARGGQSPKYFRGVAAALGYEITIETFPPMTVGSACTDALNTDPWCFVWRVNAPAVTVREMACGSGCDEAIRNWGNQALECVIRRLAPAHTNVLFGYGA